MTFEHLDTLLMSPAMVMPCACAATVVAPCVRLYSVSDDGGTKDAVVAVCGSCGALVVSSFLSPAEEQAILRAFREAGVGHASRPPREILKQVAEIMRGWEESERDDDGGDMGVGPGYVVKLLREALR